MPPPPTTDRRDALCLPCGPECGFAEPIRAHEGWIWCHHPQAPQRVNHASQECRRFSPGSGLARVFHEIHETSAPSSRRPACS